MSITLYYYIFILCSSGFGYLLIFSILSFTNSEFLKIAKDRHITSGIILLIDSIIFLLFAIFLYINNQMKIIDCLAM